MEYSRNRKNRKAAAARKAAKAIPAAGDVVVKDLEGNVVRIEAAKKVTYYKDRPQEKAQVRRK
jgi:hypothetical protein